MFIEARVMGVLVEALLDSAAELSIAAPDFARQAGLTGGEDAKAQGTGASAVEAQIVEAVNVQAAGIVLPQAPVAIIDLHDISERLAGRKLQFILGRDFFAAARLEIDINRRLLTPLPDGVTPGGMRFQLETERGVETMKVGIEGREARADFDLGNGSLPLLGAEFARRHGFLNDGRVIGRENGGGLGGAIERKTLTISHLQVGDRVLRNIRVAVDENANASDFNMGTSLLREFRIVTDFANHQLWLSRG